MTGIFREPIVLLPFLFPVPNENVEVKVAGRRSPAPAAAL
jgi:hypothetical protein